MSDNAIMALQLMGYGLLGVFFTLGLLILLIVILRNVFPYKQEKEDADK